METHIARNRTTVPRSNCHNGLIAGFEKIINLLSKHSKELTHVWMSTNRDRWDTANRVVPENRRKSILLHILELHWILPSHLIQYRPILVLKLVPNIVQYPHFLQWLGMEWQMFSVQRRFYSLKGLHFYWIICVTLRRNIKSSYELCFYRCHRFDVIFPKLISLTTKRADIGTWKLQQVFWLSLETQFSSPFKPHKTIIFRSI